MIDYDQTEQREDARRRALGISAPEDAQVRALCERIGYGAVMDSAARQWAQKDPMGAFYIGGCLGMRTLEKEG